MDAPNKTAGQVRHEQRIRMAALQAAATIGIGHSKLLIQVAEQFEGWIRTGEAPPHPEWRGGGKAGG